MTDKTDSPVLDETRRPGESFLARLHRRKIEARRQETAELPTPVPQEATETSPVEDEGSSVELTDADMPPVETLTIDSDYSAFLSHKVSESLRRVALRKLFHDSAFNVIDDMDEYAEDFTTFEALGDIVTADMRHRVEVEARKRAEAAAEELLDGDDAVPTDTPSPTNEKAPLEEEYVAQQDTLHEDDGAMPVTPPDSREASQDDTA